jgi:putative transposase
MIVGMRTVKQAATVAELIGGGQLPGKPRQDGTVPPSRYVDVGADFEAHRPAVESVSVLFDLYDGDAAGYAVTGSPGETLPTGWLVTAAKFEVQWPTDPDRAALVRSHFGARRFAFNWGLARVKADLDAKTVDPAHESVDWDLKSLRWAWNRAKNDVAPWWADNSKEAYSSGLADLAQGCKENTRRVQRHLASGRGKILNMTLSQRWGRLFVSVCYALRTPDTVSMAARPTVRAGVDLGVRTLATVATVDPATGAETVVEYPNPAPLKTTLTARRRAGRQLSRRIPGSRGHRAAKAKLSRLDRRCVHLRREATHRLTTELAGSYGHLVIETLDLEAMKRSMGRRAFRRSVSDAAMGLVKPQLAYKTARFGGVLTMADRWFASSQLHHGCQQPNGTPCRLVGKSRVDKKLVCPTTGDVVDRDRNAARNLRDWPDHASCGPVGTTAPSVPGPTGPSVGTGHGADAGSSGAGGAPVRPHPRRAGGGEARTQTPRGDA